MKKNTKNIDIILPNYNSQDFLEKTIKSIIQQSFVNWNLIIVDDSSNSKTKKILKKYLNHKKIKIFFLKKNKGTGYCRNLAIKKSKNSFIAFIDSDDLWMKNKLNYQISFMKKITYLLLIQIIKLLGLKIKK